MTSITILIDKIIQREIKIDELCRKTDILVMMLIPLKGTRINEKEILKEGRKVELEQSLV